MSAEGIRSENAEEVARDRSRDAGSAKDRAAEAAAKARDYAANMIDQQKQRAADQIGGFGAALRGMAGRLQDDRDATLAGYAEAAAEKLDRAAEYVRSRDANTMLADAQAFARKRPELVIGGMFIAGVALERLLKAGAPAGRSEESTTAEATYVPHSKREEPPARSGEAPRFPSEAGTFQSPRGVQPDQRTTSYIRPTEAAGGMDHNGPSDRSPDQPGTSPESL
jgi:hypothetical protein